MKAVGPAWFQMVKWISHYSCLRRKRWFVSAPGSGLLPQHGDHAPGREAAQRHDRPPAEEGAAPLPP